MAHHGTFPYSNIPWKHQRDLQIPAQEVSNKVGTALSGALDRCGSSAPVAMGPRWSDRFMHSNLKFNFARPRKVHESLTFRNLQMPRWHPRHVSYCFLSFVVKDVGMHISSLQAPLKCPQFGLVYAELLRTEIDMSHEPILNSLSLPSLTPRDEARIWVGWIITLNNSKRDLLQPYPNCKFSREAPTKNGIDSDLDIVAYHTISQYMVQIIQLSRTQQREKPHHPWNRPWVPWSLWIWRPCNKFGSCRNPSRDVSGCFHIDLFVLCFEG